MATEDKSDRQLLVEVHEKQTVMHTHLLGRGGLMDRMDEVEKDVQEVLEFKTKWLTISVIVMGGVTFCAGFLKDWLSSLFTTPK